MDSDKIIDQLGGTNAVAALCGVTKSAVSQWRINGIPRPWVKYLGEIHPEVFHRTDSNEAAA